MANQGTIIQLLGHATFKVTTPEGKIIIIDPWLINNPYIPGELCRQDKIDLLLITHGHEDHMDIQLTRIISNTQPIIIANNICRWYLIEKGISEQVFEPMNLGGTLDVLDVRVSMVNAFHHSHVYKSEQTIAYPHAANGYVIRLSDGLTIYFAGDTCVFGDMKLIADIYRPDVAVIPIGNRSVMSPLEAKYAVQLLGVRHIIPFHYATFPQFTPSADEFINLTKGLADIHVLKPGDLLSAFELR